MDIINQEWLVLNFLPDRDKRQEQWTWQHMDTMHYGYPNSGLRYEKFLEYHFEEALRSFAQEQKKLCSIAYCNHEEHNKDGIHPSYVIEDAPFPEPINE